LDDIKIEIGTFTQNATSKKETP